MLDKDEWIKNPETAKASLLQEIRERMTGGHPCSDSITGTDCPCPTGSVCVYKVQYDEYQRVKATPAVTLAKEELARIQSLPQTVEDDE